jgi:tetraacyldisaccharide 4'-kinase
VRLPAVVSWLLWPVSLAYQTFVRLRAWCYRRGIFKQRRLNGVVISVGNLTVGGTGKTPMVLWIAERLLGEGKRAGILTRGYRSRPEERGVPSSDEVALLRGRLGKKAQFGIGADRYAKGRMLERHGVEWFVLDDGFQHLRLARDVDIVLIDATDPFGGGHVLPAGRLREPRSALARADLVVITRSEHAPAVEAVVRHHTQAPIFYAQTQLKDVITHLVGPDRIATFDARGVRVFAFCALGNPTAFYEDLRRWGMEVAGNASFPDHHRYSQADAGEIERRAQVAEAQALLCTEKDIYNLGAAEFRPLPVFHCRIELCIFEAESFWRIVTEILERKRAAVAR